jgi:hypothetical protein
MPNPVETAHDGRRSLEVAVKRQWGVAEVGVKLFSAIGSLVVKVVNTGNPLLDAVFERSREYIASR